jgi:hypothetical protein
MIQKPSLGSDIDPTTGRTLMLHRQSKASTKRQRLPRAFHLGLVLVLAASASCDSSDGLNRQAVSGTVTFDGEPISTGAILFEPATQESGTAVGATIRQGTFAISRRDGPVPGSYRVRIYASSGVQAPPAPGQSDRSARPMAEFLPAHYNANTTLRADVRARRANRFRFDLNSSRSSDAL